MMVLEVPGLEGTLVAPVAMWPHGRLMIQALLGLSSSALRPNPVRVPVIQRVHSAGVLLKRRYLFPAIISFTWGARRLGMRRPPSAINLSK
jgi:hypothetical protein